VTEFRRKRRDKETVLGGVGRQFSCSPSVAGGGSTCRRSRGQAPAPRAGDREPVREVIERLRGSHLRLPAQRAHRIVLGENAIAELVLDDAGTGARRPRRARYGETGAAVVSPLIAISRPHAPSPKGGHRTLTSGMTWVREGTTERGRALPVRAPRRPRCGSSGPGSIAAAEGRKYLAV
jgi:hypothetical protein